MKSIVTEANLELAPVINFESHRDVEAQSKKLACTEQRRTFDCNDRSKNHLNNGSAEEGDDSDAAFNSSSEQTPKV